MAKVLHRQKDPLQMCAEFSPGAAEPATLHGSSHIQLTAQIARRTVRLLLEEDGFRIQRILNSIDQNDGGVDVDRKYVERIADMIKEVIKGSTTELPTVSQLTEEQWVIHAGNVHTEYLHLSHQLFQSGVNWGRIVAFIGFTSTYCLYAIQRGIQETIVESIAAWMVQVLRQELNEWFHQHSWDQFVNYAEKEIRRRQERANPPGGRDGGRWQGLAAVGAVGLGAVIAFAISNALS